MAAMASGAHNKTAAPTRPPTLPTTPQDWIRDLNVGIEIETCVPSLLDSDNVDPISRLNDSLRFFRLTSDPSVYGWNDQDVSDYDSEYSNDDTEGYEFIQLYDKAKCSLCAKIKRAFYPLENKLFNIKRGLKKKKATFDISSSLVCAECASKRGIELYNNPVQPQKFYQLDMRPLILREVRTIWENSARCEQNPCTGLPSAGLHVHMSHPLLTKADYPKFGKFMMRYWRSKQKLMIRKWRLRKENEYCLPNEEEDDENFNKKYLMMNIKNSFNQNEQLWHVEFRGFHALDPQAPGAVFELDEYMTDLGNLYAGACELFLTGRTTIYLDVDALPSKYHRILQEHHQSHEKYHSTLQEHHRSHDRKDSAASKKSKRQRLKLMDKLVDRFPNLRL